MDLVITGSACIELLPFGLNNRGASCITKIQTLKRIRDTRRVCR